MPGNWKRELLISSSLLRGGKLQSGDKSLTLNLSVKFAILSSWKFTDEIRVDQRRNFSLISACTSFRTEVTFSAICTCLMYLTYDFNPKVNNSFTSSHFKTSTCIPAISWWLQTKISKLHVVILLVHMSASLRAAYVDAKIGLFHHEPRCERCRILPRVSGVIGTIVTRRESATRESTTAGQDDGDDSPRGWEVVVLCDPRLFIIRCSIKQARGQLLPCSRPASSSPLRAYIHSTSPFFAFLHSFAYMHSPLCTASLSFCLSLAFPHHIYTLNAPSTSPFWIQYTLIMREWFSWAWPVAQIRVRQYFPLTVRVCFVWIRQLQMLPRQECRCILLSVHYEIKKKRKKEKKCIT